MSTSERYLIGFDLGGTKMLATLLDQDMNIVGSNKVKTGSDRSNEAVFERIVDCIEELLKKERAGNGLAGIGISCPGPIDREHGVVLETPNLELSDFPIQSMLGQRFGVPVLLENDVNAGTYGEYIRGAGRGFRHVIGIFPGTGVGGGLVLDGSLYRGKRGGAGEIGHMIIQEDGPLCGCGQYGCLEALSSRTAIAKDLVAIAAKGGSPTVFDKAGSELAKVKSGTIKKAVDAGEEQVIQVVKRAARFMGIGMANCVNIFDPEVIVLGGGLVEKLGDLYVREAERSMRAYAMEDLVAGVEVKEAELGDDATVTGAAALLLESLGRVEHEPQHA
jgi:glucokinase